jgi:hypothetical protein
LRDAAVTFTIFRVTAHSNMHTRQPMRRPTPSASTKATARAIAALADAARQRAVRRTATLPGGPRRKSVLWAIAIATAACLATAALLMMFD